MTGIDFRRGIPGLVPDAYIVGVENALAAPPVVVVHGIQRDVERMAWLMTRRAAEIGRTIVLPHFDTSNWRRYQQAACPSRSDLALLSLIELLIQEGRVSPGRFDLSGFSGGAQFAHRFAWIHPDAANRLCVTAPGWWTFPESGTEWPFGMAASPARGGVAGHWLQANLRRFLDRKIVVRVGAEDMQRDPNLRMGPRIDAQQGRTRVDRARNWVRALQRAAAGAGIRPRISFATLEGCDHSFETCVVQAQLDKDFAAPAMACSGCPNTARCDKVRPIQPVERSAA
jgi:pimeloyl-ACP methyl ester carboxylesterase